MFDKNDVRMLNEENSADVVKAIDDFFASAEADDTLLFYYSGHGRTRSQQLFLCTRNTVVERLHSTAIPESILNGIVSESFARVKILVLDCCHSGMLKGDEITAGLSGEGRYIIAATSATGRATDGRFRGMPSPFTSVFTEALLSKAFDHDGDGYVDLDDVYTYLKAVRFDGPRPFRTFGGSGAIPIARRAEEISNRSSYTAPAASLGNDGNSIGPAGTGTAVFGFLDTSVPSATYSPEKVADFQGRLRVDVLETIPRGSVTDFLEQAGVLRGECLTYAGLLLFGNNPTTILPAALVQCARVHGNVRTAVIDSTDVRGTVPEMIVRARDFVADLARIGERPTTEGAYTETVYRYPMIAVREIIANAIVHRDYGRQNSCVQIFVFSDRIEIISPGTWGGPQSNIKGSFRLGELEGYSDRRNFRLAHILSWSKIVEGVGAGVPRAILDCAAIGAPEPSVTVGDEFVTVTMYPRPIEEQVSTGRPRPAIWGREIPFRNPYFIGREKELAELSRRLADEATTIINEPVLPLYGLGGVGKTELAAEYTHRFRDKYQLCWWIRSEHEDLILNSLLNLGRAMQLPDLRLDERDYSIELVLEALSRGEPYSNWLLIFDNASHAGMVARYIPRGSGHVIITSRDTHWRRAVGTEGIEVTSFKLPETIEFLRKRVPALAQITTGTDGEPAVAENEQRLNDATELAKELDNLPLAADHAAAYLVETGNSVHGYLDMLRRNAHSLFAADVDIPYPHAVAATWSVSRKTISAEADALFSILSFFAPEPIYEELLIQPGKVIAPTAALQVVLDNPSKFRAAARELARFCLIRLDSVRNVIQMHRVVQAVTQGQLIREDSAAADSLRALVHSLLAASDPNAPDQDDSGEAYERSRQHIVGSGALESSDALVRRLIINQVRRLHRYGSFEESLTLGEAALTRWRESFGPDDRQTLTLAVEVGPALRGVSRWAEALALNDDTLSRLRRLEGTEDPAYLACARSYNVDLSGLGRYSEAFESDMQLLPLFENVFGPDHLDTLALRSNIAADLRCLGRFEEALEYDQSIFEELQRIFGSTETGTLGSRFAIARDLRMLGRPLDALERVRAVNEILERKGHPWNQFRLLAAADFGVALRRAGYFAEAAEQGNIVLRKYDAVLGENHRDTLRAAVNIINDRRVLDDLSGAQHLGEQTVAKLDKVGGRHHPNTVAARANLATVLRLRGNPDLARELNEDALEDFMSAFGEHHPNSLVVMTNLASDLAVLGEVQRARELGERSLELHHQVRGTDHPFSLATAANLSADRRASGDEAGAVELHNDTMTRYNDTLGPEHPDSRQAAQHGRVMIDIEPMAS